MARPPTRVPAWLIVSLAMLLLGCSDDESSAADVAGAGGSGGAGGDTSSGGCGPAAVELDDGSCRPAGIDVGACAEGFEPQGDRCEPVLPPSMCPPGKLAVPGDASCRDIASCGNGSWGDIPVDGATVYADDDYTALDADGSEQKPWPTIQQAIDAAPDGALVAVAEGSYSEDVVIAKPITLWGRCPALVELIGGSDPDGVTLSIGSGASGSEVRGLTITGAGDGVVVTDVIDVTISQLWVHHVDVAVLVLRELADTSAVVSDSLLESSRFGFGVWGADSVIERSALRSTRYSTAKQSGGYGIIAVYYGQRGSAQVTHCLVEDSEQGGVITAGADATIDGSVIADTRARPTDSLFGRGLAVIEDSENLETSNVVMRKSVVERNVDGGVYISGGDAIIEESLVRDTQPAAIDQAFGRGIGVQHHPTLDLGASLTMSWSVVENNFEMGVFVAGGDATLLGSVVRDIKAQQLDGLFGRCVNARDFPNPFVASTLQIEGSRIERCREAGVVSGDSTTSITTTSIAGVVANDDAFGDGIVVTSLGHASSVTLLGAAIRDSERAGLSVFGGDASLRDTLFECNAIDINSELSAASGAVPNIENVGGNTCICSDVETECRAVSAGLLPPSPAQL